MKSKRYDHRSNKYTSMVVEVDILGGDKAAKFTDELMRASDLFEEGKRYVVHRRASLIIDGVPDLGVPDLDKICERVLETLEALGGYVVFVGIRKVDDKRGNWRCWFAPGIHAVSIYQNGDLGWTLFADILRQLDYHVQTDDRMKVIAVS